MDQSIFKVKNWVINEASNPDFVHHKWFVQFHLEIFEKIAMELCDIYDIADRNLVMAITWLHDFPKIKGLDNIKEVEVELESKLSEFGLNTDFIKRVVDAIKLHDGYKESDIKNAPIEVQITSSADGASHLIGPFFPLYWFENPTKSIPTILESNILKLKKDWEKKIVLPEVKESFIERFKFLQEQNGVFPDKFLL